MAAGVLISADGMEAHLALSAGPGLPIADLRNLLAGAKVQFGLIKEVLLEATKGETQDRSLLIARGALPEAGEPGRVEIIVDLHDQPVKDATGAIDAHCQRNYGDVTANQPLARILSPTLGHPGHTVTGIELAALPGLPVEYGAMQGDGVGTDAQGQLIALANGVCRLFRRGSDRILAVTPTLVIDGDVGRRTGDLTTMYDIEIRGDILAGYAVKSGGNILVSGVIEDARVSAKGHLTAGGLLKGTQRVKAHGDVIVKHIGDRAVKCRNLTVANSVVGADVSAIGHVTARDIVGGRIVCAGSVTVDHLGDEWCTPTYVQVGINPYEESLHDIACQEHGKALRRIHDVEDHCRILGGHLKGALAAHASEANGMVEELRRLMHEREKDLELVGRCDKVIAEHGDRVAKMEALVVMARIDVKRTLHAGVTVCFGEHPPFVVQDKLAATLLFAKDGKIAK